MMIRSGLDSKAVLLLEEVLRKHKPGILNALDLPVRPNEIEDIRDVITVELANTGFKPDDSPNERGLALENLIDRLFRLAYP